MKNEFIKYNEALALKKLGFDEPCFGWYSESKEKVTYHIPCSHNKDYNTKTRPWTTDEFECCTAPLYQQCFKWFREKYSLFHNIWNYTHREPTDLVPNGFTYSIDEDWITIIGKKENGYFEKYYNTYEEAESACLDKLIEMVKDGKSKNNKN